MTNNNPIDGDLDASDGLSDDRRVGGNQVAKLSEAFSYKPPVVVPFEDMHYQTFMQGMDTRGTFFGNRMATSGDDVKQLEYTIEYQFTPEKRHGGKKPNEPAMMSVHLRARVTDLQPHIPVANTDTANAPKEIRRVI
jgi:hypothetical protein